MSAERRLFRSLWASVMVVAGLAVMMAAYRSLAADDSAETELTERVAQLINQLGSMSFEEREAAAKELARIGQPARSQLVEARDHPSAEIRSRVANILRQMKEIPLGDAFLVIAQQPAEKLDL